MTFTKTSIAATVFAVVLSLAYSTVCPSQLQAQGAENTIVVVNAESADSLAVANRYISLRNIPATNVVYLEGVKQTESSHAALFLSSVWQPVSDAIKDRGLTNQITCVTYSAGFPTRIDFLQIMKKYLKQTGKKYSILLHAPWTSISSLTYFHENVYSASPTFLEPDANRYGCLRPGSLLQNPFVAKEGKQYASAEKYLKEQDYSNAARILGQLVEKHPGQVPVIYALARAHAFNGKNAKAIQLLEEAQSKGFAYRSLAANDPAFADLKSDQDFKSVLSNMEDLAHEILATRGFAANSYWSKNGWPSSTPEQGQRYLLSTVLATTGKNQSTLDQALAQIQRSVEADGTNPTGNVYFAKHKDARSRTRHSQFEFAAAELESLKRSGIITDKRLPENDQRVVGATLGSAVLDWNKSGSRFVPGAICDNFTSYGGWWAKSKQTQLSEFLNAGAAGASGTVYEPYTIPWKIPSARLHANYARGCTLAESFYQSVNGPFQLLIVGDPLCCPFGDFPKFEITGPEKGSVVKSNFNMEIKPALTSPKIRHYEIYYDGVFTSKVEKPEKIKIAINAISDGHHELRVVGVADTPTANRTSQQLEFVISRKKNSVSLNAASPKVSIGRKLYLNSVASTRGQIQIRQNSRVLATVASGSIVEIDSLKLGLGKTRLQAFAAGPKGSVVASTPLDVEIVR